MDYFVPKTFIFRQNLKINLEAYLYFLQIRFKHKIPLSITYVIQFYKGDSPLGRKGKRAHSCETMVNETLWPRKITFIRDYKWHFLRIWQFYQRWETIFHPLTRYREIFSKTNLRPVWRGKQQQNWAELILVRAKGSGSQWHIPTQKFIKYPPPQASFFTAQRKSC